MEEECERHMQQLPGVPIFKEPAVVHMLINEENETVVTDNRKFQTIHDVNQNQPECKNALQFRCTHY